MTATAALCEKIKICIIVSETDSILSEARQPVPFSNHKYLEKKVKTFEMLFITPTTVQ